MSELGSERRPIATRELKISADAARWLARCGVSANSISLAGMMCGVGAGVVFYATSGWPEMTRVAWVMGAVLVQMRLLANMLDGMVAIEGGKATKVGELYNDIPDRVSDAATLIGLGFAASGHVVVGLGATVAAILTAYVRAAASAAGASQQFCGPMAKPQRMFAVTLVALYMGMAPSSWQPEWAWSLVPGLPAAVLWLILLGSLVTAVRRLSLAARELRSG